MLGRRTEQGVEMVPRLVRNTHVEEPARLAKPTEVKTRGGDDHIEHRGDDAEIWMEQKGRDQISIRNVQCDYSGSKAHI